MTTDGIDDLIERAAEKQEELLDDVVPKEIKITRNARKKASPTLGKIVADAGGSALEWYSLSVARKGDPEFIIRDIMLPAKQTVTGAHVAVSGEEVAKITHSLSTDNKGLYVVGWLHNHGTISTFHSGEDDENMQKVLNSVSLNTEKAGYKRFDLIESAPQKSFRDGRITIQGKDLEDAMMEYSLKHPERVEELIKKFGIPVNGKPHPQLAMELLNELLEISQLTTREPRITGFAYSIVVNNQNDSPYTEIAVIEEDVLSKKKRTYVRERVPLTVVDVPDDITVDEEALKKEVKEKIELPKPTIISTVGRFFTGKRRRHKGRVIVEDDSVPLYPLQGFGGVGYVQPAATSYTSSWDEPPEKATLQELCKMASKELADYLNNYTSDSANYSKHLGKVVESLLEERDLRKAFASAGALEEDKHVEKPKVLDEEDLEACIYCSLYFPLRKSPDKAVVKFLIDCAKEETDIDKVIKEHAAVLANPATPVEEFREKEYRLVDENPLADQFFKRATAYSAGSKADPGYNYWFTKSLIDYTKDSRTLSEAILENGWPKTNREQLNEWMSESEKTKLKRKLRNEKDPAILAFMKEFGETQARPDELLEECITAKTLERERKDGNTIDTLLGNKDAPKAAGISAKEILDALVLYTATDKGEFEFMYGKWMTLALRHYLAGKAQLDEAFKSVGTPVADYKIKQKVGYLTKDEAASMYIRMDHEKYSGGFNAFAQDLSTAIDLYIDSKPASPSAVVRRYFRQNAPKQPEHPTNDVDALLEGKK